MPHHGSPPKAMCLNNNKPLLSLMDFVCQKFVRNLVPSCVNVSHEAAIRYWLDLHSSERLTGPGDSLLKWHTLITCKLVLVIGGGPSPPGSLHMAWVSVKHDDWALKANILRRNEGRKRERERDISPASNRSYMLFST